MTERNANARLEALSDGVFAIAMTLLVIEIRAPDPESIHSSADLWSAVWHALPTIAAFLLSFTIIFITWVNHHAIIRDTPRTSATFLFANGLLLLTVAFIPYPTALLGEFILTDHAGPAVVLYNAVLVPQAVSWTLMTRIARRERLARDAEAEAALRVREKNSYGAMAIYSVLAMLAIWLPVTVAIVTTATWVVVAGDEPPREARMSRVACLTSSGRRTEKSDPRPTCSLPGVLLVAVYGGAARDDHAAESLTM